MEKSEAQLSEDRKESRFANSLISIITPAFNASLTIHDTILSVLHQTWHNWELIIIDDGSTDNTKQVVEKFSDSRIHFFYKSNGGVSTARNFALSKMKGDFFCFLDADDMMPPQSLSSRLKVFADNPDLAFVGGAQEQRNHALTKIIKVQYASPFENPLRELIKLNPKCFINCGTWLIRRHDNFTYHFPEDMTHGEDLVFFLSISHHGKLGFSNEVAQVYRRSANSAMSNLAALATSYLRFYSIAKNMNSTRKELFILKYKALRIIILSFLANKEIVNALVYGFKMIRA
jgi:teichuronic acid biosynthesis glycosyltransferase TuaG